MKKLLNALKGFPVGNCLLLLTYVLVFMIDGNSRYVEEVSKLADFKYMTGQFIASGMAFVVVFFTVSTLADLSKQSDGVKSKKLFEIVKILVILLVVVAIIATIRRNYNTHSMEGYIGEAFMRLLAIFIIWTAIVYGVKTMIDNNRINKALKEKQKENN